jgi:polar amino acid transport system substrate-binding protein
MALRSHALLACVCALSCWVTAESALARPLQQVLNEGVLRVGTTLAPPWAVRAADGTLTGFEVDVAKQLAQDMGVRIDLQIYEWDRLIRGLEAGEIDLIAAGLSITPARALHVNFSRPYAEGGVTLATHREATAAVAELTDLDAPEHTVAVVTGSVAEELLVRVLPRATASGFATPELATTGPRSPCRPIWGSNIRTSSIRP